MKSQYFKRFLFQNIPKILERICKVFICSENAEFLKQCHYQVVFKIIPEMFSITIKGGGVGGGGGCRGVNSTMTNMKAVSKCFGNNWNDYQNLVH